VSVEHIEAATEVFRRFLKTKQLKVTRQREILLRRIFEREEHFTVDTLEDHVKGDGISKATIYRTLQLMVECGLVAEVEIGENRRVYEHVYGHQPHDHIVCTDCKKVFEFVAADVAALERDIARRFGFRPSGHSLRIEAECLDLKRDGRCDRTGVKVV
jgi:Fur family ferric uptake transcriptional regulator